MYKSYAVQWRCSLIRAWMKKRKDEKCDSFEEEGEEKEEEDKIFFLVLFSLVIYSKQLANQAIKALWLKTALTLEMSATAEAAAANVLPLFSSQVLSWKKKKMWRRQQTPLGEGIQRIRSAPSHRFSRSSFHFFLSHLIWLANLCSLQRAICAHQLRVEGKKREWKSCPGSCRLHGSLNLHHHLASMLSFCSFLQMERSTGHSGHTHRTKGQSGDRTETKKKKDWKTGKEDRVLCGKLASLHTGKAFPCAADGFHSSKSSPCCCCWLSESEQFIGHFTLPFVS